MSKLYDPNQDPSDSLIERAERLTGADGGPVRLSAQLKYLERYGLPELAMVQADPPKWYCALWLTDSKSFTRKTYGASPLEAVVNQLEQVNGG